MLFQAAIVIAFVLFLVIYPERHRFRQLLNMFKKTEQGYGTVYKKEMVPYRTETYMSIQFRSSGSANGGIGYVYEVPETREIPAEFLLYLDIEGLFACAEVSSTLYEQVEEGDRLSVRYQLDRSSQRPRVLSVGARL